MLLLFLLLINATEGFTCYRTKFPYYISLLVPIDDTQHCLLYQELRECNGKDLLVFIVNKYGLITVTLSSMSSGMEVSGSFMNNEGPVDRIDSLSIEIVYDTIIIYDDFVPIRQLILEDSNMAVPIVQCENVVQSSGNCLVKPCSILSCGKVVPFSGGAHNCMKETLPICSENRGFCHGGECIEARFNNYCQCKKKGFLRGPYLGDFCSIKSDETFLRYAKLINSFDVELDFVNDNVIIEITSVFENFAYTTIICILYKLPMLEFVDAKTQTSDIGDITISFSVQSNTSYVIKFYGKHGAEQSFHHFTEIHTPGYSLVPPPTNLMFNQTTNGLISITWTNHEVNSKQVKLTYFQSVQPINQSITTTKNYTVLSLASNTKYTIVAQNLNTVGEEGPESSPLTFKTPYFIHDINWHGSHNFSSWLFRKSTVSVSYTDVNFKNTIRRDLRVNAIAIVLLKGTNRVYDLNMIYQSIIYNSSYESHERGTAYITALFRNHSIPKTLVLGDDQFYHEYWNGALNLGVIYQVYAVMWYMAESEENVSLQYVGEVRKPETHWLIYLCTFVVGTVVLLLVTTLGKYLFCKKDATKTLGKYLFYKKDITTTISSPSSLTVKESVYSDALHDAEYIFNKPSVGIVEHTFSATS